MDFIVLSTAYGQPQDEYTEGKRPTDRQTETFVLNNERTYNQNKKVPHHPRIHTLKIKLHTHESETETKRQRPGNFTTKGLSFQVIAFTYTLSLQRYANIHRKRVRKERGDRERQRVVSK